MIEYLRMGYKGEKGDGQEFPLEKRKLRIRYRLHDQEGGKEVARSSERKNQKSKRYLCRPGGEKVKKLMKG